VTASWTGVAAAVAWTLLCVRWFDVAAPWRPSVLQGVPPGLLLFVLAACLALLLVRTGRDIFALPDGASRRDLCLLVSMALAFRLPMAWTAAVGYTTPDGSLSGIVAWRIREGIERLVFVPSVPYSGSLKSHLAAALGAVVDLSRAFTLASVFFYAAFVAAVYALAATIEPRSPSRPRLAALYLVFAPAFVTRYSLSNDGNYVEVLALGTFALWLAARSRSADSRAQGRLAWTAGLALGLAFWCHILAVIHAGVVALAFVVAAPRRAAGALGRLAIAFALGYMPGLLWNAANGWESFAYLLPGGQSVGTLDQGPSLAGRLAGMVRDQWPVLMGYDPGYGAAVDAPLLALAVAATIAMVAAFGLAARRFARDRGFARGVALSFAALNLGIAVLSLPYIPGNPRYLLFLAAPIAIVLADACDSGRARLAFGLLVVFGLATSLGQWPSAAEADARWRGFVSALARAGVTHCYTDFYLAAKIDLVSEEAVVCASDLGPTATEYFRDYPKRVAAAPQAALIPVNTTAAGKLERRLQRLGVAYQRFELMKPVLVPARNVHPTELFPP
jgi:hypothetical protein